ncbi:hypothetical protein MVEN_00060300 [Mycena venus]|uniref:Uncharacterized protein n=1 Tax=Mycena venus TaxID=2733690 RepID=A0A8H6Z934_9AGAR|nr:hypothetical protein MVEN_00060300 [Mycena venus]
MILLGTRLHICLAYLYDRIRSYQSTLGLPTNYLQVADVSLYKGLAVVKTCLSRPDGVLFPLVSSEAPLAKGLPYKPRARFSSMFRQSTMPFYVHWNPAVPPPPSSPVESRIHGVVAPAEQLDTKVQLWARLRNGQLSNMPVGFPFRHVMSGRAIPQISFDPYEFREELDFKSRCSGHLAAQVAFTPAASGSRHSKKKYLSWCATLPKLDLRPYTRGPPPKVPVAHVRVDTEVMNTMYGAYIERDPRIILRALSISLELGLLVTITLDDCGHCSGQYSSVVYIGTANNGRRSLLLNAGSFRDRSMSQNSATTAHALK